MAAAAWSARGAPAEDKSEPAKPLAVPSLSVHPAADDVEEAAKAAAGWRSVQYLRKRRCVLCCCGCIVTAVVVAGLVALVLALTVLRVKDPRVTMNNVSIKVISAAGPGGDNPDAVNVTFTADVSIENPNVASLRFSPSETEVYYRGQTVTEAHAPGGRVGADGTVRMNVTADLLERFARALDGAGLVLGQGFDLTTYTEMDATVKVLGIYKKDLQIRMNCSVNVEVAGPASVLVPGAPGGVQSKSVLCVANVS